MTCKERLSVLNLWLSNEKGNFRKALAIIYSNEKSLEKFKKGKEPGEGVRYTNSTGGLSGAGGEEHCEYE